MTVKPASFPRFSGAIAAALLALIALLSGTLAPQGFMPTHSAGGFAIKLCSGHPDSKLVITRDNPDYDLLTLIYGQQDESAPEPEQDPSTPACAFAGGTAFGLASSAPEIAISTLAPATHEPSEPRRFALRNRINIPPATGPPATV
ncbi:hypothetical protein [Sphingorhabdus sp. YGSMI21]|uniref:hypothetical protein n=1 Tax=Sphingorhabdus sp. YGSMI21 TaxID=2077182 RepID=UPI000C1F1E42|nr:hypothetical protein [Sphingorhabdus sp. YGSMI21]ATW04498.1 hypothetical protein CHN51_13870 [Sphingorhabdus sp. YGSMI21]